MVAHVNELGAALVAGRREVRAAATRMPARREGAGGAGRGGAPSGTPPRLLQDQLLSGRSVTRRVFSRGLPNPLCVTKRTLRTPSVTVTVYVRVRAL